MWTIEGRHDWQPIPPAILLLPTLVVTPVWCGMVTFLVWKPNPPTSNLEWFPALHQLVGLCDSLCWPILVLVLLPLQTPKALGTACAYSFLLPRCGGLSLRSGTATRRLYRVYSCLAHRYVMHPVNTGWMDRYRMDWFASVIHGLKNRNQHKQLQCLFRSQTLT